MRRLLPALLLAAPLSAQSLTLQPGQHAVEAGVGWSTADGAGGPAAFVSVGIAGRIDVGSLFYRFEETYDSDWTYDEVAPFVRVFLLKQGERDSPVSVALHGQAFFDDYENGDEARYFQVGPTFYRSARVTDDFAIHPFIGFAAMTESYAAAGEDAERTTFLQRDLGLHLTTRTDRPWLLGLTLVEQAYNTSTYREARLSVSVRL